VVIDGAVIGSDPAGAREIDAAGTVLLPGLIDAHLHLHGRDTLEQLAGYGVTTGLDMACWPQELVNSLRGAAGLSPAEALRAATSRPAQVFGLSDRGAVEPGLRADLVLIEGDPLTDIRATRCIRRIWCAGVEHVPHG